VEIRQILIIIIFGLNQISGKNARLCCVLAKKAKICQNCVDV